MTSKLTPDETAQSYTPPTSTQFSVFLDNRCGKLLELLDLLTGADIKLAALSVSDSADHAVVRLVTSRGELTRQTLRKHNLAFSEIDVLIVEVTANQSLNKLCLSLLAAELNIHYAYPVMSQRPTPSIVLHCDDLHLAAHILRNKRFTLLGEGDIINEDHDHHPFDGPPPM